MIRGTKSSASQAHTSTKPPPSKVPKLVGDPTCKYSTRICYQPVLVNYDYCLKHILEDANAPYRPCSFVYPNGKKCSLAAPIVDKIENSLCALHSWKIQLKGQRKPKHVPPTTPEYLLTGLAHYVRPARPTEELKSSSKFRAINPFVEADVSKAVTQTRAYVLECASESDSDVEPTTLDRIWQGANEDSSDAESVDSQLDDPLKHSGLYSAEEVVAISRRKLQRLQNLYQNQLDRLQHVYRERRRLYLLAIRKEKETLSSIYNQPRTSAKEQKLYEKLKSHNRYHKRSFFESLLYLANLEKRAKEFLEKGCCVFAYPPYMKDTLCDTCRWTVLKLGGINIKPLGPTTKCNFTEGGVRCTRVTLPLVKFCIKHVMEEKNQRLFGSCGCVKADSNCLEPVAKVGSADTCLLHVPLSNLPHSVYPETEMKSDFEGDKKSSDGSEVDPSATDSAFSTDPRDSPENSVVAAEETRIPPGEPSRGRNQDVGVVKESRAGERLTSDQATTSTGSGLQLTAAGGYATASQSHCPLEEGIMEVVETSEVGQYEEVIEEEIITL